MANRSLDEPGRELPSERVAAVVLTHNRRDLLRQCLISLARQTRSIEEIIVVDNASKDGTAGMVQVEFPDVTYFSTSENLGAAGGFAVGMELAYKHGHDWIWLFSDDHFPKPRALERCLRAANCYEQYSSIGVVAPYRKLGKSIYAGGLWKGKMVFRTPIDPADSGTLSKVDFLEVGGAGALVSRDAVASVGYFRRDYFMMWFGLEYCLRLQKAGFEVLILTEILVSGVDAGPMSSLPWRGYYQTRNHLLLVLELGSLRGLLWWFIRQVKLILGAILFLDHKWQRVSLRLLGVWHGFQGVTGRTIDPAKYSQANNLREKVREF